MSAVATPPPVPAAQTPPVGGSQTQIVPAPAGAAIPPPVEVTPPKPGSARDGFFNRLEKFAKDPAEAAPAKAGEAPKPGEAAKPDAKKPDAKVPDKAAEVKKPAEGEDAPTEEQIAAEKAAATDPKKKVNPWKLAEDYKKKAAQLERERDEVRKLAGDPEARKSELEKFQKIEARAKELEEHIKFVDYSKSSEFQEKYQQPYEQAWTRAMADLKEITVLDPATGNERPVSASDLLELVNMPLGKAREAAKSLLGDSADDVMLLRKEIRGLYDAQATALEKARKEGVDRVKAGQEQMQAKMKEVSDVAAKAWEMANKRFTEDPKYSKFLKAADGDVEGAARLEKGYKFVDDAFARNSMDPKLTHEERAKLVERQAAARHRAATWPHLKAIVDQKEARISELESKLAEYEKTAPDFGGGSEKKAASGELKGMARLEAAIEARSRPGL